MVAGEQGFDLFGTVCRARLLVQYGVRLSLPGAAYSVTYTPPHPSIPPSLALYYAAHG